MDNQTAYENKSTEKICPKCSSIWSLRTSGTGFKYYKCDACTCFCPAFQKDPCEPDIAKAKVEGVYITPLPFPPSVKRFNRGFAHDVTGNGEAEAQTQAICLSASKQNEIFTALIQKLAMMIDNLYIFKDQLDGKLNETLSSISNELKTSSTNIRCFVEAMKEEKTKIQSEEEEELTVPPQKRGRTKPK